VDFSAASLKDEHTIEISGLKPEDETNVKQILVDNFTGWDFQFSGENASLSFKQDAVNQIKEQAILQTVGVMRKRLSALGLSEKYIQREIPDSDRLKLRLPPDKHPSRVIGVIRMGGILEFRHVTDGPFTAKEEALNAYNGTLPEELNILKTNPRGMKTGYYVVKAYPVITGRDLENARQSKDNYGRPNIAFTLTSAGAEKFRSYTSKNIGKKLAIVLDNYIESAPVIQTTLFDKAVITGNFTIEEAEDLAWVLNSGGLPAPVKILEEKTIAAKEK
jgi:preprotein translocase subunit SecD